MRGVTKGDGENPYLNVHGAGYRGDPMTLPTPTARSLSFRPGNLASAQPAL